MAKFQIKLRQRNIPEQEILDDLKLVSNLLGKTTITALEYIDQGKYGVNTVLRRFKKWNEALLQAGLEAPNRQHIPDSELFENLANTWTALGRQPVGKDLDKSNEISGISLGTYESRFGSWNKALMAFQYYIENEPNLEPVVIDEIKASNRRTSRSVNWRLRAQVLIRDNCICQMCGASPAKNSLTQLHADHIKPWSKGGETVIENLQTLCSVCNIGKSDLHDE